MSRSTNCRLVLWELCLWIPLAYADIWPLLSPTWLERQQQQLPEYVGALAALRCQQAAAMAAWQKLCHSRCGSAVIA